MPEVDITMYPNVIWGRGENGCNAVARPIGDSGQWHVKVYEPDHHICRLSYIAKTQIRAYNIIDGWCSSKEGREYAGT